LLSPQDRSFCLLDRLISPNPPSLYWVRDILNLSWKFALPFEVDLLLGDRILFKVFEECLVQEIMDNGPYNIKGSLLVVKPWPPELTSKEVDLSSCAFWVQVHGLPLQNMMVVNAIKIGKLIGLKVLDVEDGDKSGIISHHHLRICILLDVSLPLVPGFHLPRSARSVIWIKFLYERLADYCTLCGCIGRQKSFCPAPPPLGLPDRYGTSLRGYVYLGTRRLFSSRHASGSSSPITTSSPLCTEELGSILYLQGVSCSSPTTFTVYGHL
jgi:hypothetical protein